jgi:GntR family transcriptional repressor for pyruvate dehydrogenase complex
MPSEESLFTESELSRVRQREATLTTRVTNLIEKLIVENRLQPGDRLPSIHVLADQFGVSRTVVREAIRALVAKSLLEVRHGSGTTVREPSASSVAQSMALLLRVGHTGFDVPEVHEVRRLLEVEIAGLAAERHTAEDLAALERNVREMDEIVSTTLDRDRYITNDVAFHATLARATHNRLLAVLLDSIADVMRGVRQIAFDLPGSHSHAIDYHRTIYERIECGDAGGARRAMKAHLDDSEELMREALALHTAGTPPTPST